MVAKDLSGLVIDDHVPLFAVPPCLVGACCRLRRVSGCEASVTETSELCGSIKRLL